MSAPDAELVEHINEWLANDFDWATRIKMVAGNPGDKSMATPCGSQPQDRYPFYCPTNSTIYWPSAVPLPDTTVARQLVLAHETGHHVMETIPSYRPTDPAGVVAERRADCLAGSWFAWSSSHGYLPVVGLSDQVLGVYSSTPLGGAYLDATARTHDVMTGFEAGPQACAVMGGT